MSERKRPKVIIIGTGFGGLWAARSLAGRDVDVLIIDRNNYHTFLALLYQVAAAELEAEDIAYPVRSILWNLPHIDFVLGHVHKIDPHNRIVMTETEAVSYEYLIVATGSITHTFGILGIEEYAYGLKTLEEAVLLKNHIICCFEEASRETDMTKRERLLTFTIVGGGATGVEYAGALSELVHGPLVHDYPAIDFNSVRIVLVEASGSLIAIMPKPIRTYALERLRKMGVEVCLNAKVLEITPERVLLDGSVDIPCRTVVWSAGVKGEPVAALSGLPAKKDGRIPVLPTLQVPGHLEIYVIGDLALIEENGKVLPMVAQVAIQSGITAAKNILCQTAGREVKPFRYRDRGSMITIGRNAAGVAIAGRSYTGFFAWLLWLFIHLFNLIGFRNRVMVLINWAWDYLLYERAVRFIFPSRMPIPAKSSGKSGRSGL